MNNFSFIVSNIVISTIEVLINLLTENNVITYMDEITALNDIKEQLRSIEKEVRTKNVHK
jgi:transcription initiation factor IIE alpha subunit